MQADLVLTNGVVYTVDARRSRHEALAVKDGRIVALGSASEAAEWCGPRTRTVDLGGRLVLPGFIDAHLHPTYSTFELFEVKLADCRTLDDCLDRVARFAAQRPELPAIRGGGWFPTVVSMDGMTAAALDRVVPDRPVLLHDDSVHAHWVNSMTLRRAGIGRHDPGWPGAVIERLPDGSPKGLLHEAFLYLDRALPQADHLILVLPSDTGTDNLIDARRLALLPARAVVYNVGRGNCLDERALARALKAGALRGACLDVFKEEPLTRASPLAGDLPGLVRLPHSSAFDDSYMDLFVDEVIGFLGS